MVGKISFYRPSDGTGWIESDGNKYPFVVQNIVRIGTEYFKGPFYGFEKDCDHLDFQGDQVDFKPTDILGRSVALEIKVKA